MKKAQTALEYALVIAVLVSAILAMQIYMKRSFQGRFRETADSIGQQYAPGNTTSEIYMSNNSYGRSNVTTEEIIDPDTGTSKLETTTNWTTDWDVTDRWGEEKVKALKFK